VPRGNARNESVSRVRRLMARLALLRRRAVAVFSADDQRSMNPFGVGLPGRLGLMAVDASRVRDNARDRVERLRFDAA